MFYSFQFVISISILILAVENFGKLYARELVRHNRGASSPKLFTIWQE